MNQNQVKPSNSNYMTEVNQYPVLDLNSINRLSFIQYKPNGACLFYDSKDDTKLERITTDIHKNNTQQQLFIYSWRKITEFPVIKTNYVELVKQQKDMSKFNIYYQVCNVKLSEMFDIPLNQIIYLLKESIIGFQRLFNRFGTFQITPNMICTNQKGECKIWLNQRFQLNSFIPSNVPQFELLRKIPTILSARVHRTKTAIHFFQKLHQAKNVLELLNITKNFIDDHKIQIPRAFSLVSYSVLRNTIERFIHNQKSNEELFRVSKSYKKKHLNPCPVDDQRSCYSEVPQKLMSTEKLLSKNITTSNLTSTSKLNPYQKFNQSSTLKISTNTANTHSFKTNLSNYYFSDQKALEPKKRKASLKNMTNSYQIHEGFEEQPFSRYFSAKKLDKYDVHPHQPLFEQIGKRITPLQSQIVEDQQQQQSAKSSDQGVHTEQIYKKNGWQIKNIQGILLESGPMKLSYKIGKQINPQNEKHQFTILKPPGLVYESILPDQQNE